MSTSNSTTKSTYHHLTSYERGEIFAYHRQGKKPAEIARLLGRHRSTIHRELRRGAVSQVKKNNGRRKYTTTYFPGTAQHLYEQRRQNSVYCKLDWCTERFIEQLVSALKAKPRVHSVDTFIQTYQKAYPLEIVPSTKTVYRYIHAGLLEVKPLDLPRVARLRRRKNSPAKPKQAQKQLGMSIEQRPAIINDRARFGDWEIDLVLGKKTRGEAVVMTLVERQTRYGIARKLPDKKAETITEAVKKLQASYPMLSITADNGVEFSQLSQIEDIDIYFAHPYSSHERGTNENFNGLLREYLPKGQSINPVTPQELQEFINAINQRPRRLHHYKNAKSLFELAQTV